MPRVGSYAEITGATPTLAGFPAYVNDCADASCSAGGGTFVCHLVWNNLSAWEVLTCSSDAAQNWTDSASSAWTNSAASAWTDG